MDERVNISALSKAREEKRDAAANYSVSEGIHPANYCWAPDTGAAAHVPGWIAVPRLHRIPPGADAIWRPLTRCCRSLRRKIP